jgi:DTW domain-containing protein
MNQPLLPRRATCADCLRAQSACICGWVRPLVSPVALLILQHPLEVANAKNSARLLHLSVAGSVLAVGEAFDAAALDTLLHAGGRTPVLLYPDTPRVATPDAPTPGAPVAAPLPPPERLRLVVLDATWRKSRKMLYLNPLLQQLPRLALSDMPASHYRIRKAHAPDQLSTLEAGAHALGQVEGDAARYAPLFAAFDGFVGQQAAYLPHLARPA